jgi:isoleucyl-tRNA synthetase
MARRALLPWYHAFSFLRTYASIDGWSPEKGFHHGSNILDRWILSKLQTLKAEIGVEMDRYRLYNVVPKLFEFIEDLTNWYIRLNRHRFWGEDITADKIAAYSTLHMAVQEVSTAMAPFAPFLSEYVYQELARLSGVNEPKPGSVHLCSYPVPEEGYMQPQLEETVARMQQVILLGRRKREEEKINLRTPLKTLIIIHRDGALLQQIETLEEYLKAELNVKQVRYEQDEGKYIELRARPNFPVLGKRLGKRMKAFQGLIQSLGADQIEALYNGGTTELGGETFTTDEIQVFREAKAGTNTVSDRIISIDLDCGLDDNLIREGYAREVAHLINRSRKDMGLEVSDRVRVAYGGAEILCSAVAGHREYITAEVLAVSLEPFDSNGADAEIFEADVDGHPFRYTIAKDG